MKRIYKEYIIKITEETGSKVVRINKNVDMSCFKIARETYNKTKEMYIGKNEDIKIELIGVGEQSKIGNVIYSKQFLKEIQEENKELLTPTDEIVDNIKSSLEILMRKRDYHTELICALNKKQDIILHNIENLGEMSNADKLDVINNLEEVRRYRRFHKTEQKKLKILDVLINLPDVNELFNSISIPIDAEDYKYLNTDDLENMNIMKEVKYKTEKDRIHRMEELRKKYDKIVVDSAKNVIICYNRGYAKRNKLK